MSVGTILGILGGVLGAGGSVAGGILSKPDQPRVFGPQTFNPASDPLTAFNTLDLLASQGIAPLDSILAQSGPLQQAIQAWRATTPLRIDRNRDRARIQDRINEFINGIESTGAQEIARAAGYRTVAEAHAAQEQFKVTIAPQLENLKLIATLSNSRQMDVEKALRNLAGQPLDFGALREQELARLNRQLDFRQTDALRAASVGGFNPGRQLEGIENLRRDADLDAISRAVGALSGQAQSIANLQALNPANRAQQFSPSVVSARQPSLPGAIGAVPQVQNPFGASVAQAANQLGGTISSLGLIQLLNQQRAQSQPGPAVFGDFGGNFGSGSSGIA